MAKDTEKLIRQLSLISFLMATRRPVSALEIKQEVEGYSSMNEDAFARRFYADRAELDSLGIELEVQKPSEGFFEAELYALPPENYYLPQIEFTDQELAALATALSRLDGEFAYAEPLRLALQQVSWGRTSPLEAPDAPVDFSMRAPGGKELSQRLSKIETAISRRKRIEFRYYTMERDETADRKVDPYHLVFRAGEFYLIGYAHERDAVRVFRLSRIRGKVSYASKAEHDFTPPRDFDRHDFAERANWQMGELRGPARVFISDRVAWLVERDYGSFGTLSRAGKADGVPEKGMVFETKYASARELVGWALSWGRRARILEPPELAAEAAERMALLRERHAGDFEPAEVVSRPLPDLEARRPARSNGHSDSPIRPERFARLVTLAGLLIEAARNERRLPIDEVTAHLKVSREELVEDVAVLNVVNFGGGTYVLYAEVGPEEIEVDADAYGDNFDRPARLLPLEAKALVAAIDLFGEHLPQADLSTARTKIVEALGHDPSREGLEIAQGLDDSEVVDAVNTAITEHRRLEIRYYKENEDQFTKRVVEPYTLTNRADPIRDAPRREPQAWYVWCWDTGREGMRHFRLDRIKQATLADESFEPRPEVQEMARDASDDEGRVARVWVSPERARWLREERPVVEELADGAVVVELPFRGMGWLVREVMRGAGELAILEPEDAREAVQGALSEIEEPVHK